MIGGTQFLRQSFWIWGILLAGLLAGISAPLAPVYGDTLVAPPKWFKFFGYEESEVYLDVANIWLHNESAIFRVSIKTVNIQYGEPEPDDGASVITTMDVDCSKNLLRKHGHAFFGPDEKRTKWEPGSGQWEKIPKAKVGDYEYVWTELKNRVCSR